MWIFEWVFGWFGPAGGPPRDGIYFLVEPNELDLIPQIEQLDFVDQTEDIDMMVH